MTSLTDQIRLAQEGRVRRNRIEDFVRDRVVTLITEYSSGTSTYLETRKAINTLVRSAYVSSQTVGSQTIAAQADIEGWEPKNSPDTTYLKSLMADARLALQDLRASTKDTRDQKRAIMRIGHSAGTAAQRGNTDALIQGAEQLAESGIVVEKMWLATFAGNTPCLDCVSLHGTTVEWDKEFPHVGRTKVYRDLMGPPRHPRCRCTLVTIVRTLDNVGEELTVEPPEDTSLEDDTLTTEDVKRMSKKIFTSVVSALKKIWKSFTRK